MHIFKIGLSSQMELIRDVLVRCEGCYNMKRVCVILITFFYISISGVSGNCDVADRQRDL